MTIETARKVLLTEADAIRSLAAKLDSRFSKAVELIYGTNGRVIIIGMGKPGFIAQKISASLSSTGTASMAIHPADAAHGDLGRIRKNDVMIFLSKSGETNEIVRLLPFVRSFGCKIIAITSEPNSQLARMSDIVLEVPVKYEAAPLNVAPTTSTTCMLAMGDALTMALVKKRKFEKKDFANLHPGGTLGKVLFLKAKNVMRHGQSNPCVTPSTSVRRTLAKISAARAGAVTIVDRKGKCLGIFTDGDLRRNIDRIALNLTKPISEFMTKDPVVIFEDQLASEALTIMKKKAIDEVPVVDQDGRLTGLLDVQDLIREGFVY
jgi:arabinose-5-phosphate isomerase